VVDEYARYRAIDLASDGIILLRNSSSREGRTPITHARASRRKELTLARLQLASVGVVQKREGPPLRQRSILKPEYSPQDE